MRGYLRKNGVTKRIFGFVASLLAKDCVFTPPTGMSATNVQDAIEELRLIKAVGQPRTVSIVADNFTRYGAYDPDGGTSWSGYDMNKLVSLIAVVDSSENSNTFASACIASGLPACTLNNRRTTENQSITFHVIAYFRP